MVPTSTKFEYVSVTISFHVLTLAMYDGSPPAQGPAPSSQQYPPAYVTFQILLPLPNPFTVFTRSVGGTAIHGQYQCHWPPSVEPSHEASFNVLLTESLVGNHDSL